MNARTGQNATAPGHPLLARRVGQLTASLRKCHNHYVGLLASRVTNAVAYQAALPACGDAEVRTMNQAQLCSCSMLALWHQPARGALASVVHIAATCVLAFAEMRDRVGLDVS